jgi:hypothetical protein
MANELNEINREFNKNKNSGILPKYITSLNPSKIYNRGLSFNNITYCDGTISIGYIMGVR